MRQFNYALVPERPLDTPVYRKGWKPVKPRPRPYPKPAASVGAAAILAARRRSREDARPVVPAPAFQVNYVGFHYALVPERPLDTPGYRMGRPIRSRSRPYPKPAASVKAATILAARRRSREDARPLVPAPAFQNVDNYVGFPPAITGYVPEYGDDMEVDATGPFFTPVAPNTTYGNPNPLPYGVATAPNNGIPINGPLPAIQVIVGYVPELSDTMEVDWEGPAIQSGPSYHPIFNGSPQILAENVSAPYNPVTNGAQVTPNAFPPNAGLQVVEDNVFVGINVNVQVPTYLVQPPALDMLNASSVVTAEEHPGDRGQLFNELFGNDGEEEDEEEENIAPDLDWGGGGDHLVGEHDVDEDEDEDDVEIIV